MRLKDELRFLQNEKKQINLKLYRLHFSLANTWVNSGPYIQDTIEDKLQRTIGSKEKTLHDKLHRLDQQQRINHKEPHTFFPRIVNNQICSSCRRACCCCNKNYSRSDRICCKPYCSCCKPRSGTSKEYRTTSRHCAGLWRSGLQKPCGGSRRRIRIGFRPGFRFRIRRAIKVVRAAATWEGECAGGFGNG